MHQQVIQKGGVASSPYSSIPVCAFIVGRKAQALGEDAPLQREVLVVIKRGTFVGGPTYRAVVDHNVFPTACPKSIFIPRDFSVAHPKAEEADNHVVCLNLHGVVGQGNTFARCRLSRQSEVSLADGELTGEVDGAGHLENDDARPLPVHRVAQRPGEAVILEGSHFDYLSPSSSRGMHSTPESSREGLGRFCHGHGIGMRLLFARFVRFRFDCYGKLLPVLTGNLKEQKKQDEKADREGALQHVIQYFMGEWTFPDGTCSRLLAVVCYRRDD